MMKQIAAISALALILGCSQKPSTSELKRDTQALGQKIDDATKKAQQSEAGQRISHGAKEAAQGLKQGAGTLTKEAGEKLKKTDEKLEEKAKSAHN